MRQAPWADEAIAEAAAHVVILTAAETLAGYLTGAATVGETLDNLSWLGCEATRLRLTGWAVHDRRAA